MLSSATRKSAFTPRDKAYYADQNTINFVRPGLKITIVAAADELAAAASLVMGEAAEGTPAVHVRGFPYPLREGSLKELLRPKKQDLFR